MRIAWRALVLAVLATTLFAPLCFAFFGGPGVIVIGNGELNLPAGDIAPINVVVDSVPNLYSVEFHLKFNPAFVRVVDFDGAVAGIQSQPGNVLAGAHVTRNRADNNAGTLQLWAYGIKPAALENSDGVVFTIYVQGLAGGATSIAEAGSWFTSPQGRNLDVTVIEGKIVVSAATDGAAVEPAESVPETIVVPTTTPSADRGIQVQPGAVLTPTVPLTTTQLAGAASGVTVTVTSPVTATAAGQEATSPVTGTESITGTASVTGMGVVTGTGVVTGVVTGTDVLTGTGAVSEAVAPAEGAVVGEITATTPVSGNVAALPAVSIGKGTDPAAAQAGAGGGAGDGTSPLLIGGIVVVAAAAGYAGWRILGTRKPG